MQIQILEDHYIYEYHYFLDVLHIFFVIFSIPTVRKLNILVKKKNQSRRIVVFFFIYPKNLDFQSELIWERVNINF